MSIKNTNNGQVFNFTDNTNGDYVFNLLATDTIGRVNNNYELTVIYNGTTYTSSSKLKKLDHLVEK